MADQVTAVSKNRFINSADPISNYLVSGRKIIYLWKIRHYQRFVPLKISR